MAYAEYRIRAFRGLNQSASENTIDPGETPDARNMDTSDGRLSVAKGYVHASETAHPAPGTVRRLLARGRGSTADFIAVTTAGIDRLGDGAAAWQTVYSFDAPLSGAALPDLQTLKISSTEYLLAATGEGQMVKWDGTSAALFGSAEWLSDFSANFIELYFNRLFAAGDPAYPCRLYWSAAPGDARTIEDFSQMEASENVSGGHVEVGTDSDPITGLAALSNQLVIFKRDSVYRLLGDRPENFRIYPVNASMEQAVHTACVRHGDVLYFLTRAGLYYFDGQSVHRMPDADKIRSLLAAADLSLCTAACCRDKLYFAVRLGTGRSNDALIVYDLIRRTYMVRDGFTVQDLCAMRGTLYLMDGNGYLCRFGEGSDYAGREITAYWTTPETDLDAKLAEKRLCELYLRGSGGVIAISANAGRGTVFFERLMPPDDKSVLEAPLTGGGRAFSLRLANEGGSHFTIDGGLALLLDVQRRVL